MAVGEVNTSQVDKTYHLMVLVALKPNNGLPAGSYPCLPAISRRQGVDDSLAANAARRGKKKKPTEITP